MIRVVMRAMLLGLVRDRGALAMSFVLPVLFFLIFASIFSGASGQRLRLRVAVADEVRSPETTRLLAALAADTSLELIPGPSDAAWVREQVRRGRADAGLIARAGGRSLARLGGMGRPPLLLITDPARAAASRTLAGIVQKAYFVALPDVALRSVVQVIDQQLAPLSDDQKREIEANLEELRQDAERVKPEPGPLGELMQEEPVVGQGQRLNHVAYTAGAVAVLFLMLSAAHGALTLFDERDAEILDRLLAGPAGSSALVAGKLLFLTAQGLLQVLLIFVTAWLVYGVSLPRHLVGCVVVSAAAAAMAAGVALALVAACATRRQAQTTANFAILVLSAVGGSMVPRFFMPPAIQRLGWVTPTTWALEAYTSIFWRDAPLGATILPLALLTLAAAGGAWVALRLTRRWETL